MEVDDVISHFKSKGIDKQKCIKLAYYARGLYLDAFGNDLFEDEIQAWADGPVLPNVHQTFSDIENEPIEMYRHVSEFLDCVINEFSGFTGSDLATRTRGECPWRDVYVEGQTNVISTESMKRFFATYDSNTVKYWKKKREPYNDPIIRGVSTQPKVISFFPLIFEN